MKNNRGTAICVFAIFLFSTLGVVDGAVNLVSNPGFESGTASWNFYTSGTGSFTTPSPGYEGNYAARLALTSSGTNIQFYQTGVTLEANTRYRLSFAAYSNTGHDITVRLFKHVLPYTNYMPDYTANLGTSWQAFTTEFTTSGFTSTVNDGRFMFWLSPFAATGDNYYIDAIILEKVGADTSPPIVIGNTPTGTGVPVTSQITVTFNESMNQATAQSAFSTSPATSGSFTWSSKTMTYTPSSSISAGTTYTIAIGTGAKDLAGNSLQSPYSWQFTTASVSDTSPPIVTDKTPTGTGVPVTSQITVTFNESMNQATAQSAFSTSPATSGSFSWSGNMMTYTPGSSLLASTTYTVIIGTGAKDLAGNSLQSPYSWSFTTSGASSSI
ncbi:MAG TPA: Ig-like domain-containing protein [Candidatus Methanoperedens sp.]